MTHSTIAIFEKSYNGKIAHLISVDGKYLTSFGSIGHGPGEFLSPQSLTTDMQTGKIYIYDLMQCHSHIFDKDSVTAGQLQTAAIDYRKFIGNGMFRFNTVLYLTDTSCICIGLNDKCRFMYIENDSINYNYTDYPLLTDNIEHNWSLWNNGASYAISPDGKHIIAATHIGMALEILNIDNGRIISKIVKGYKKTIYAMAEGATPPCTISKDDTYEGIRTICTANDGFYACIGGTPPEFHESSIIYKFDYDGNITGKIKTSSKIECLTTDGHAIYALATDDEEYVLKRIEI